MGCTLLGDENSQNIDGEMKVDASPTFRVAAPDYTAGPIPDPNDPVWCPEFADDLDSDGACDAADTCNQVANADQADADGDAFGYAKWRYWQGDNFGDACDLCPNDPLNDIDLDFYCENNDNCPGLHNPGQEDADMDGRGDACDEFPNGDPESGITTVAVYPDVNCNGIAAPDEGTCLGLTANLIGLVSVCTSILPNNRPCDEYVDTTGGSNTAAVCNVQMATVQDLDGDLLGNACDNCDSDWNPDQKDTDMDGTGDACE